MPIDPSQNSRPQSPHVREPTQSGRFRQLPSQVGERIYSVANTAIGFISSLFGRLNSLIKWTLSLIFRGNQSAPTEVIRSESQQPLLPPDVLRSNRFSESYASRASQSNAGRVSESNASRASQSNASRASQSNASDTTMSSLRGTSSTGSPSSYTHSTDDSHEASSSSSSSSPIANFIMVHTESSLRREFEQWLPRRWQSDETFGHLKDPIVQLGLDLSRCNINIGGVHITTIENFQVALQSTPFANRAGNVAEMLCQAVMGPAMTGLTFQVKEKLDLVDPASEWQPMFSQRFGALQVHLNPPVTSNDPWIASAEIHFEPKATCDADEEVLLASRIALRTEASLPSSLANTADWNLTMTHSAHLVPTKPKNPAV